MHGRRPRCEPVLLWLLLALPALLAAPRFLAWPGEDELLVSATTVRALADDWRQRQGREPSRRELERLVEAHIDEELLMREALRLGLHEDDAAIRERLWRNARFVGAGNGEVDLPLLDGRPGMLERDPVIRRHLAGRMRRLIESAAVVSEADVARYLQANPRYTPARYSFEQRTLAPASAPAATFDLGTHFDRLSIRDIDARFGGELPSAVPALAIGVWSAPLRSAFGRHQIRVLAYHAPRELAPAQRRREARRILLGERRAWQLASALRALRARHRITIALPLDEDGTTTAAATLPASSAN